MHLSKRLPPTFSTNLLSKRLLELKKGAQPIFDLTLSNPSHCGFSYPEDYIVSALSSKDVFNYSPDPKGLMSARVAISEMHGGLNPDQIQLTASTSEAYSLLFKLLADSGDNVLVPSPSYPLFEWLARLEGIEARPVPSIWHDGWNMDVQGIEEACDAKTRAIVVVNPNNPTGQFLTKAEWNGLLGVATKKKLPIIADEVFACYPVEPQKDAVGTILNEPIDGCPVFLLSGLSKSALLPQLKLGWIAMLGTATDFSEHLAFLADQYLSVSAPTALAAPQLITIAPNLQCQAIDRIKKNIEILDKLLLGHPHMSRLPVHGGWSVLIQRPDTEDDETCVERLLSDHRLLIHPGHFYDIPKNGFLVASLLPSHHDFTQAVQALLNGLRL
ncbi:MAG: pyridoxal phosphate-dependent aminotransferase [Holophagales bacterium]|jgi:aspartate/methionine/tyrosine aminotransferase|nr:pyridoxal phosphate-dependent aminotransferase [Holophagales bacterium]